MTNEQDLQNIKVPLDDFIRAVARVAAELVIKEHAETCIVHEVNSKVDKLSWKLAILIGAVIGSGFLGGTVGALLAR